MKLIADMIAFAVDEVPKWNPINICSYHLQEAGATPVRPVSTATRPGTTPPRSVVCVA